MEGVARPVDDRLEELVPRSGGRGEARDVVQEAQLLELIRLLQPRVRFDVGGRHVDHDTSVEKEGPAEGCDSVKGMVRNSAAAGLPA